MAKQIRVIGSGLVGCTVAYLLDRAGFEVQLVNAYPERSASRVAAGIFNPITGKRWLKSWMVDAIFPCMEQHYKQIEHHFGVKCYFKTGIYKPIDHLDELHQWQAKSPTTDYNTWVHYCKPEGNSTKISRYGAFMIPFAGWLDINTYTNVIEQYFCSKNAYSTEFWSPNKNQHLNELEVYCEGWQAIQNPLWNWLPFKVCKGELIGCTTKVPTPPYIINKNTFVLPVSTNSVKVGATYQWDDLTLEPNPDAAAMLLQRATQITGFSLMQTHHWVGIRPATADRRPFIGRHPQYQNCYIVNGFGSKAVSLAPYFVNEFVKHLVHSSEITPEANIQRFNQ